MRQFVLIALLASAATLVPAAQAAGSEDADALSLADKASGTTEKASDWRVSVEGALGESSQRYGKAALHTERTSVDVQYDKSFAPGWRFSFSDRLDVGWRGDAASRNSVNTLKETYLSWQADTNRIADLGRINVRNGVASGYKPTDYFRTGALRSVVSVDPASLSKNRLGSVMLRGQQLWDGGSLTALYSPKLEDQISSAPFDADLGATNNQHRWLLSASHKFSDNFSPQVLLYHAADQSPQLGLNLNRVFSDSIVAYVEWSGGQSRSLRSQALNMADDSVFRSRLSTGLTYTTAKNISLNLEYDYNGAALDQTGWDALRRGSPVTYSRYRSVAQNIQDPVTKQSIFFFSTWQDALINHLDLTGMVRFNLADSSRLTWAEGRYHWDHVDLALQWQRNGGRSGSEFGALTQQRIVQAVATYFF
ncbi:hypothetical protein BH11PSE12_BH11PSE12_32950 [soil metagenome]